MRYWSDHARVEDESLAVNQPSTHRPRHARHRVVSAVRTVRKGFRALRRLTGRLHSADGPGCHVVGSLPPTSNGTRRPVAKVRPERAVHSVGPTEVGPTLLEWQAGMRAHGTSGGEARSGPAFL